MSQLYGHDGRGNYYGGSLIDPDASPELSIPFEKILTTDSTLDPDKLDGATDYAIGFLGVADREGALSKLDITEAMLTPGKQGPQGVPGPTGPAGLIWKGAYSDTTEYSIDDAVGYSGASYYCIRADTIGITPGGTENGNWALLAAQGAQGQKGDTGDTGLRGPQGATGAKGDTGATGPQGAKGDTGGSGKFDISTLTQGDIQNLYDKLLPLVPKTRWVTRMEMPGSTGNASTPVVIPLADTNLQLQFSNYGNNGVTIKMSLIDANGQSVYDVKRSSQYDGGIEGASWNEYTWSTSWTTIDGVAYGGMRESDWISIFDRTSKTWWRSYYNIVGNWSTGDNVFILVETKKLVEQ